VTDRIVVVGGGLAAGKYVAELRERGHVGPVAVFAEEPHPPYERPPLSKGLLLGSAGPEDPLVHERGWYADHEVDLRLGRRVTGVDLARRVVVAGDAEEPYDTLLLATGARPRRLAMADAGGVPVRYLRTLDDSLALKEELRPGRRVGIVGGGWIGLEVAAAARHADAAVTVFEAAEQPLLAVLGSQVAEVFAGLHRQHGVDLRTSARLTAVQQDGDEIVVRLHDEDQVRVDLLVVGIGVEPAVELAVKAGLSVDDGIRTDAHLRTSDPHVLAAGDVANADHPVLGRPVRVEHWDTAIQHARVAAGTTLGEDAVADALPYFFTDQYDLGMEYVGSPGPDGFDRVITRGDPAAYVFTAWWLRGDRVVAGMQVNDWDAIADVRRLVGTPVDDARLADATLPLSEV
jgi:3-phenylpropionate/trans-cinnamate dioxygenase ferredoxin reductase subunit